MKAAEDARKAALAAGLGNGKDAKAVAEQRAVETKVAEQVRQIEAGTSVTCKGPAMTGKGVTDIKIDFTGEACASKTEAKEAVKKAATKAFTPAR